MFVLDDPYIHLALAENILHGHYGVNLVEYSAPSSSILWPIIIAPLTLIYDPSIAILVVNIGVSLGIIYLVAGFMQKKLSLLHLNVSFGKQVIIIAMFVLATNLIGLSFIGMEHNLQVLFAVIIAIGLVNTSDKQAVKSYFWWAVILAPLIRYENILISAIALLYCFWQKDYVKSILAGVVIVCLCALFSYFLLSLGLQYLPDSILAKSKIASSGFSSIAGNFLNNFLVPMTLPKAVGFVLLVIQFGFFIILNKRLEAKWRLAICAILLIFLQLSFGRIGWFFRYEMAVWAFLLIIMFDLFTQQLSTPNTVTCYQKYSQRFILGFIVALAFLESFFVLAASPFAASNVYHQQYQMHRFLTEIYQQPVAVNDLGWTSFRNNNYVLDFWGLGSNKARVLRQTEPNVLWMDKLAADKNVKLVMIYTSPNWFPEVPKNWIKVAEFDITGPKITAQQYVAFFVRDEQDVPALKQQLQQFNAMLPKGSVLRITN